jgi:hypothetical protein
VEQVHPEQVGGSPQQDRGSTDDRQSAEHDPDGPGRGEQRQSPAIRRAGIERARNVIGC